MRYNGRRGRGKTTHNAIFNFPLLGLDDALASRQCLFLSFFVGQSRTVGLDDAFQSGNQATTSFDALRDSPFCIGEVLEESAEASCMDWGSGRGLAWVGELVVFGVGCGHGAEGCGCCFGNCDLEGD